MMLPPTEAEAFAVAVQQARDAFDAALQLGFDMTMLDIGGGFPGQSSAPISFEEVCLYFICVNITLCPLIFIFMTKMKYKH